MYHILLIVAKRVMFLLIPTNYFVNSNKNTCLMFPSIVGVCIFSSLCNQTKELGKDNRKIDCLNEDF